VIVLEREDWLGGRFELHVGENLGVVLLDLDVDTLSKILELDQGAPCFEPPATDEDWAFLFGNDPEEEYQP
jgi:hypothetical protein